MIDNVQKQSGWIKIGNAIDSISTFAGAIAGFAMLFVSVITTYEVIMRHFFKNPTIWTYEVSSYILVWFGFLSSAYGLKQGGHIHVDILVSKMKPRTKLPLDIIAHALCFFYAVIMFVYSWQMAMDAFRCNETAPTLLQAPMYLVELGMVIGTFLLSLQALRIVIVKIAEWINLTRNKEDLKESSGVINNPWFILPCFSILSVLGIWCYAVSPGIGLVFVMIILLFAGVPVFVSLGIIGTLGLFILLGPQSGLPQTAAIGLKSLDSFVLLAIPLYILVGQILMESGIGNELFDVCVKWVGHIPGGMAAATIGACAIFAAISGSSVATAATVGMVAIPEMLKRNYDPKLVYGTVASGGTLGILIPPSAAMIIYSAITDESTGALFMGGVIPGIILTIIFALFAVLFCVHTGRYEKIEPFPWKERFVVFKDSFWGLMTPVIIIFTIYTGVCTPTEAAALAVVYALAVSLFRGKIKFKELNSMMAKSTRTSTMILMIVVGALQLGMITTFLQVPQRAIALVGALDLSVWVIMVLLCVVFVILGMFLEVVSILLITMPIVHPLIIHMGFNGVWFGVFIVLLMEMALITPPVGLNVYVIQGVANAKMSEVISGVLPFMVLLLTGLLLIYFFPQLVLWFPGTMGLGGL